MTLKLHNSLSKTKEDFVPRDPARVTLYVCGPTVYNYAHIGNARPAVVFDVLFRLLRRLYGEDAVLYARNVTDVDDKINKKAADEGVEIGVITDRYLAAYHADMGELGVMRPSLEPHATAHIPQMIAMMRALVDKGHAYAAEGHVLFDTTSYGAYGELSGRSLDDMIAGARVEVAPYKKHPADFVLWKPSKPGEPVWDSPFGPGRPGWHIECSAMIEAQLGLPIDIHGGGHDLIFPHHENEIAQGVCAHGHGAPGAYARYWMHNGFLTMDAEKMSKSLGNVLLVHDLVKAFPGEVIRWALLSAHYRAPLDWTDALLEQSRKSLDRLYGVLQDAERLIGGPAQLSDQPMSSAIWSLCDDLNTPQALANLFVTSDRLRSAVSAKDKDAADRERITLLHESSALGLLEANPDVWFKGSASSDLATQVEALLERRKAARAAKDWPAADAIRGELDALGVVVMDGPQGASWRMK